MTKNLILKFFGIAKHNVTLAILPRYNILSIEQTIEVIVNKRKSISRFGDGEFLLLLGVRDIVFQKLDTKISKRLFEVINSQNDSHLVCLTSALVDRKGFKDASKIHWENFLVRHGLELAQKVVNRKNIYGNALISRFYHHKKDKSDVPKIVSMLKNIWNNLDLLFIEGEYSRLGVGNDLFENARSVKRIICKSENAFENYSTILQEAKRYGKDKLIIIALGPTATILAYDLACAGYWALDLGHIDIEYSWYLAGATDRVPIAGKKAGEVRGRNDFNLLPAEDALYVASIIRHLL